MMALLVLFSTLSFNVSKHYCAGEIASVSYFVQADGCAVEEVEPVCDPKSETQAHIEKKSCCDTEIDFVDGSDFFHNKTKIIAESLSFYLPASPFENLLFSVVETKQNKDVTFYQPPLLSKDVVVLYETYLI